MSDHAGRIQKPEGPHQEPEGEFSKNTHLQKMGLNVFWSSSFLLFPTVFTELVHLADSVSMSRCPPVVCVCAIAETPLPG